MNKLLLLLPSLASADLIQDLYKEQFYQLSKSNFEIITAFLLIFIIIALIYIFSLAKKSKHKTIVQAGNIISTVHTKMIKKDVDLLRILDGYLSILHQKVAKRGNKVCFNFSHRYPRYVKAMHDKVCMLFYTLSEFVIEHTENSHIMIGLRTKKSSSQKSVRYEFYIKSDCPIPQLEKGDIKNTLEKHSKMIEIIHKGKKELKNCVFFEFYKLKTAKLVADILGTKINFSRWQKHNFLSFELEFELSDKLCKASNRYSHFFGLNTIILEDDICGFYQIASKLKQFKLNIQPKMDLKLAKEHLFNPIFLAKFIFINTRVLRNFTAKEINHIKQKQAKYGFVIILISDSAAFDHYNGSFENYVLLKRPVNMDTLLAAMNTPPPPDFSNKII
ncbi:MAG: hypothetical protein MR878_00785 [Campylobacter sp.]|uniref:hypothetical protein n=1 Tax=Campylobacter sp. TaxID=205 RepID=UPI002AA74391|nr:hypothetical protein [Campylobacter sp.]MCI7013907.1 hypothetical protein [Campylobacter sp.]